MVAAIPEHPSGESRGAEAVWEHLGQDVTAPN